MPKHSLSIGVVALVAAAVVLSAQAHAEHENRYFGFGYQPFGYPYPYPYPTPYPYAYVPPPVVYPPSPSVRESTPEVYEYEVSPGRWVRVRPGYQPPDQRFRVRTQPQEAWRSPGPPPVPKRKPEATDEPEVAIQTAPATTPPARSAVRSPEQPARSTERQVRASSAGGAISCEAAADIVRSFGFSDVQSTSCSGDTYGFDAARDGSSYSIKLSAANGELTEVRRR
jgi:hypothetical protein